MEIVVCAQCGVEIESKGLHFRGRVFCGDECCEEFEEQFSATNEPNGMELEDDGLDEDALDATDLEAADLGYREEDFGDSDDLSDDDFDINPEDF